MSKKDKVQSKINIYCIYLAGLLAAFLGILGFMFSSFFNATLPTWASILCIVGLVIVGAGLWLVQLKLNDFCDELERL